MLQATGARLVGVAVVEAEWDEGVDALHAAIGFLPPEPYRSPSQQAKAAGAEGQASAPPSPSPAASAPTEAPKDAAASEPAKEQAKEPAAPLEGLAILA